MSITVEGIFLKDDFSEFITETFAQQYNVDLRHWIVPFAYYDPKNASLIHNGIVPEGIYILFGKVKYPGKQRFTRQIIHQFNLLNIKGLYVNVAFPFNKYVNVPQELNLEPIFPIFKLDEVNKFNEAISIFREINIDNLTTIWLQDKLDRLEINSLKYKIYKLRLALQLDIDRGK